MMNKILGIEQMAHTVDIVLILENSRELANDLLDPIFWRHFDVSPHPNGFGVAGYSFHLDTMLAPAVLLGNCLHQHSIDVAVVKLHNEQ